MDELVQRLSTGDHPVEMGLRPQRTVQALQEAINRGYVHVKFTGTRGGTELGFRLDTNASDLSAADFSAQTGNIHLTGDLTLNYERVRCIADIDLATLAGTGRLQPIAADVAPEAQPSPA